MLTQKQCYQGLIEINIKKFNMVDFIKNKTYVVIWGVMILLFILLQYSSGLKLEIVNFFGNQKPIFLLSISFLILSFLVVFYKLIVTYIKKKDVNILSLVLLLITIGLFANRFLW